MLTKREQTVAFLLVVCALLSACAATPAPNARPDEAYVNSAWAYFKNKCDTEAGEKIYKTFSGVKSVLIVKPLPPATEKDLFDQFWMGDPYSDATPWNERDISKADNLLRTMNLFGMQSIGFEFVEIQRNADRNRTIETISPSPTDVFRNTTSVSSQRASRFGVSWEDTSTQEDRKYWVAGSRLRVIDLTDNNVVAERVGFFIEAGFGSTAGQRRPWLTSRGRNTTCPQLVNGTFEDRLFILKVLNPATEK
jgi:hypothetical protein